MSSEARSSPKPTSSFGPQAPPFMMSSSILPPTSTTSSTAGTYAPSTTTSIGLTSNSPSELSASELGAPGRDSDSEREGRKMTEHTHQPWADEGPGKVSEEIDPRGDGKEKRIVTGILDVPVTLERKPFIPPGAAEDKEGADVRGYTPQGYGSIERETEDQDLKEKARKLKVPGVSRANYAPSSEAPVGTADPKFFDKHAHESVLQQHCAFFDRDNDKVLWPSDTYIGFRRLGFNIILSIPDPFFRIFLDKVHKTKHGSDTGSYDNEGRFVPQKFEDFFAKYSTVAKEVKVSSEDLDKEGRERERRGKEMNEEEKGRLDIEGHVMYGLTLWDAIRGWKGQRCIMDPIGWTAELLEWLAAYLLLWPKDGIMRKEDCRRIYDGSIFYDIAERREKEEGVRKGQMYGGLKPTAAAETVDKLKETGIQAKNTVEEQLREQQNTLGNVAQRVGEAVGTVLEVGVALALAVVSA